MALEIDTFPDPRDPANPLKGAVGWVTMMSFNRATGAASFTVQLSPNAAAKAGVPVETLFVALGQNGVPKVADVIASDANFAAAWNTVVTKCYELATTHVPACAGATKV